ncbi:unnamed protein product, partial [Schistosoma turkestanicum]
DWMRAISRCSYELIRLTLEDLEDHYTALTIVKQTSKNKKSSSSSSSTLIENNNPKKSSNLPMIKSSIFSTKRSNPFNKSNSVTTNNSYDSNSNSIVYMNQSHRLYPFHSSNDLSNHNLSFINHTQWLLTQNWEQLNTYLIEQFIISEKKH